MRLCHVCKTAPARAAFGVPVCKACVHRRPVRYCLTCQKPLDPRRDKYKRMCRPCLRIYYDTRSAREAKRLRDKRSDPAYLEQYRVANRKRMRRWRKAHPVLNRRRYRKDYERAKQISALINV